MCKALRTDGRGNIRVFPYTLDTMDMSEPRTRTNEDYIKMTKEAVENGKPPEETCGIKGPNFLMLLSFVIIAKSDFVFLEYHLIKYWILNFTLNYRPSINSTGVYFKRTVQKRTGHENVPTETQTNI